MKQRTADPYTDSGVIDARAPRFNQATIGTLALVAFLTGFWPLVAVLAAQLAVGLVFGRRFCLPCLAYFELVQPRLGEGQIEDSRPPRFANVVGAVVLSGSALALATGLATLGWALALLVAGLALFAATSGVCAGCELYKLGARLRGIRAHLLDRIDLDELGLRPDGEVVVQFGHPLCTGCHDLERRLAREGLRVVTVDVSKRPELARKYGIAVVPTAVAVGPDGAVSLRLAG
ncbi:MAG: thioredoxin family protein [Thermoleophilia bacterium]|nr:thioredoxin family protein [Thermoleophilia bacterium]